jgi:ABC-type sugar transport system ATPase subunit
MEPILTVRNMTKRFGGLTAVNNVSWDVYPGEVVGLLGDNGAGKSTLIKCISGVYHADEGDIIFKGRRVEFAHPIDARRQGIETIYQDLALANNLDVGANIFLGREVKKRYLGLVNVLDDPHMLDESRKTLESLHIHFPTLTQPIESLSGGQRQAVAIARAVYWDAKLMIMDEPTNNLGVPEQQKVLELIRRLRDQGVPVILITHILPDVFAVTDRLIVMRRGRKVTEKVTRETTTEELVQYMVGARDDTRPGVEGPQREMPMPHRAG